MRFPLAQPLRSALTAEEPIVIHGLPEALVIGAGAIPDLGCSSPQPKEQVRPRAQAAHGE